MKLLITGLAGIYAIIITALSLFYLRVSSSETKISDEGEPNDKGADKSQSPVNFHPLGLVKSMSKKDCVMVFGCSVLTMISVYLLYTRKIIGFESEKTMANTIMYMLFVTVTLIVAMIDKETRKIPNKIVVIFALVGIVFRIYQMYAQKTSIKVMILSLVLTFVISACVLFLVSFVSRGGIGYGDIKFLIVCGVLLGISKLLLMMSLSLISCLTTAIFLVGTHRKTLKDTVPFGPFMFMGYILGTCIGVLP